MSQQRLFYIDNLKAFLIILVILGHSIQFTDLGHFDNNILFRYIYSFHMPLFMMVSGFLSYREEYTVHNIKKRFAQLVVPFVAWSLISLALNQEWNFRWLICPDTSLWFLWVLFWIYTAVAVASICAHRFKFHPIIATVLVYGIIYALGRMLPIPFGYGLVVWHMPFFYIGILCRRYSETVMPLIKKYSSIILLAWIIGAYFWSRLHNPSFLTSSACDWGNLYRFVVALCGILGFMGLFRRLDVNQLTIREIGGVHSEYTPSICIY